MRISYSILVFITSVFGINKDIKTRPKNLSTENMPSIYDFKIPSLSGDTIDFSKYKGKKILIVNTASKCGYTPQYEDLQKLNEQYGGKVTILGFPCDDFGHQEPGSANEIASFCKMNYGVTFQLFEKVHVKGAEKHPLYQWLTDKSKNGWNTQEPNWNFCKYLVNEKGELVKFYASSVKPMSKDITEAIQ